jgi:hypothetical protein
LAWLERNRLFDHLHLLEGAPATLEHQLADAAQFGANDFRIPALVSLVGDLRCELAWLNRPA